MASINTSKFIIPELDTSGVFRLGEMAARDRYRNQELEYRREQEKEQNIKYNLNRIKQLTDFDKYNDIEPSIDRVSSDELAKIQSNALQNYVDLDPAQMEMLISTDMQPFLNWNNAAKQGAKKLNEDFGRFKEQNKNIDLKQAYDYATDEYLKDFIDIGEGGTYKYKKPNLIQPRDYVGLIRSPEGLRKLNVNTGVLQKALESIPKHSVGDKQYTSRAGRVHKFDWSGLKTDFSEVVEDKSGRPEKFQLATDRKVGDVKLIPQDLKSYLLNSPEVENAVIKLWDEEKMKMESKGAMIDPKVESEMFDAWLYEVANKHLPHDIKISTADVTPRISINTGSGSSGNNAGANWVNRAAAVLGKDDFGGIEKVFGELHKGGIDFYDKIETNPSNPDELIVKFKPKKAGKTDLIMQYLAKSAGLDVKDESKGEYTINKKDPQLRNKLAGLYQFIMGADKKVETPVYPVGGGSTPPKPGIKKGELD